MPVNLNKRGAVIGNAPRATLRIRATYHTPGNPPEDTTSVETCGEDFYRRWHPDNRDQAEARAAALTATRADYGIPDTVRYTVEME